MCRAAWGGTRRTALSHRGSGPTGGNPSLPECRGTVAACGRAAAFANCSATGVWILFPPGSERPYAPLSPANCAEFSAAAWETHRCAPPRLKASNSSVLGSDSKANTSQSFNVLGGEDHHITWHPRAKATCCSGVLPVVAPLPCYTNIGLQNRTGPDRPPSSHIAREGASGDGWPAITVNTGLP